jgi:hypothetical protein
VRTAVRKTRDRAKSGHNNLQEFRPSMHTTVEETARVRGFLGPGE